MTRYVVGVDLALRRSAVVALPFRWGGDFGGVLWEVIEGPKFDLEAVASAEERAMRTVEISAALFSFVEHRLGGPSRVVSVCFENYAFGSQYGREYLAEAQGVCKADLHRAGYRIATIPLAHARKILLGKVPSNHPSAKAKRKAAGQPQKVDAKLLVKKTLDAAGAGLWDWQGLDEYDACCTANGHLYDIGGRALVGSGPARGILGADATSKDPGAAAGSVRSRGRILIRR